MRRTLLLFTLLSVCALVQSQTVAGTYQAIHDTANSYISYQLQLQPDGRFSFHFYRKNSCDICVKENKYGRGSWIQKGKKVFLSTQKQTDVTEDFVLDLGDSKAHFIFKSPRDKTDKVVPTRLKFYDSSIFWIKGMEVVKK